MMAQEDIDALTGYGWSITYCFDAAANTGCYVLKRGGERADLNPADADYDSRLTSALVPPTPAPPPPLQDRVAAALQDLQAQPTISGADLAAVIQALTD